MDMIAEIRRRHLISQESISSIARDLHLSRPTVRKHCRTQSEPVYRRGPQPAPRLGAFQPVPSAILGIRSRHIGECAVRWETSNSLQPDLCCLQWKRRKAVSFDGGGDRIVEGEAFRPKTPDRHETWRWGAIERMALNGEPGTGAASRKSFLNPSEFNFVGVGRPSQRRNGTIVGHQDPTPVAGPVPLPDAASLVDHDRIMPAADSRGQPRHTGTITLAIMTPRSVL